MAKGNIHNLGLGIIKQISREVEKDTNTNGIYDSVEPFCKGMLDSYFPNPEVEIHPLVELGWKLFNRNNSSLVEEKVINLKDEM